MKLVEFSPAVRNQTGSELDIYLAPRDRRLIKILAFLDSVPTIAAVLILVVVSCTLSLVLDPELFIVRVVENATTIIFSVELGLRLYCIQNWHLFVTDLYVMVDTLAVILDIILLGVGGFLGSLSGYTKVFRSIRFLKLIRLLRLARLAKKISQTKVAGKEKAVLFYVKTDIGNS